MKKLLLAFFAFGFMFTVSAFATDPTDLCVEEVVSCTPPNQPSVIITQGITNGGACGGFTAKTAVFGQVDGYEWGGTNVVIHQGQGTNTVLVAPANNNGELVTVHYTLTVRAYNLVTINGQLVKCYSAPKSLSMSCIKI